MSYPLLYGHLISYALLDANSIYGGHRWGLLMKTVGGRVSHM